MLEEHGINYFPTDTMRLDDRLDGISLSIESINESMYQAKKREYRIGWGVLQIEPSILWTHECRFCWVNAASNEIRKKTGFIGGPWAFERMFEDYNMGGKSVRAARSRANYMPTNNDAEVQVLEPIHPSLIRGVIVQTEIMRSQLVEFIEKEGLTVPVEVLEDL